MSVHQKKGQGREWMPAPSGDRSTQGYVAAASAAAVLGLSGDNRISRVPGVREPRAVKRMEATMTDLTDPKRLAERIRDRRAVTGAWMLLGIVLLLAGLALARGFG